VSVHTDVLSHGDDNVTSSRVESGRTNEVKLKTKRQKRKAEQKELPDDLVVLGSVPDERWTTQVGSREATAPHTRTRTLEFLHALLLQLRGLRRLQSLADVSRIVTSNVLGWRTRVGSTPVRRLGSVG